MLRRHSGKRIISTTTKPKLSARIAELKDSRNPWERVRFEVLLEG